MQTFKEDDIWSSDTQISNCPDEQRSKLVLMPPLLANGTRQSGLEWSSSEDERIVKMPSDILLQTLYESKRQNESCKIEEIRGTSSPVKSERIVESKADPAHIISFGTMGDSVLCEEANEKERHSFEKESVNTSFPLVNQNTAFCDDTSHLTAGENRTIAERRQELLKHYVRSTGETKDLFAPFNSSQQYMPSKTESNMKNDRKRLRVSQSAAADCSLLQKPLPEATSKQWKAMQQGKVSSRMRACCESLEPREVNAVLKEKEQLKGSQKVGDTAMKLKHSTVQGQEKTGNATSKTPEVSSILLKYRCNYYMYF